MLLNQLLGTILVSTLTDNYVIFNAFYPTKNNQNESKAFLRNFYILCFSIVL